MRGKHVVLVAAIVAPLLAPPPPAAHASFSGRNGTLAWTSSGRLYTAYPDGSHWLQLPGDEDKVSYDSPYWSPDGRWLGFMTTRRSPYGKPRSGIYVVRVGTRYSHRHFVVEGGLEGWTPSGRLFFRTTNRKRGTVVWTIRPNGTGKKRIFNFGQWEALCLTWDPTGRWITYCGGMSNERTTPLPWLCLIHPDGSGRRCIASHPRWNAGFLSWSPDGRWLLFYRDSPAKGTDVLAYRISDGRLRRFTFSPDRFEVATAWSPDSRKIVYAAGSQTFMVNVDLSHRHPLGYVAGYAFRLDWGRRPGD